jgi:hypothetical protein
MTNQVSCVRALLLQFLLLTISLVALSGCSSGIPEFQQYVRASDAQAVQGAQALDRVAEAERIVVKRRLGLAGASNFNPDLASYYIDVGDPPITAGIRSALTAIKNYNAALGALANGEAADALSNRVGAIVSNLIASASAFNIAFGGPATSVAVTAFLTKGSNILGQALPIFREIATLAGREAFRRELVLGYPHMRNLLVALRDGTPAMFEIIKRSYVKPGSLSSATGISPEDLVKLDRDRKILAGWVVLIDGSLASMELAVKAAMENISIADLATLEEASVELRILAEKIRDRQKVR